MDDQPGGIPPEVYDLAFGWNPTPEIERLLFCCRELGVTPASALELGCGTGRLLAALESRLSDLAGLDLDPAMVAFARSRTAAPLHVADMSTLSLGRTFDLIYTSANTIRCVTGDRAIERMWRCIADHLSPGGVFIADLELGLATEAAKVGRPISWTLSRGETESRVTWAVIEPPAPAARCCRIEWTFELRRGDELRSWRESFPLRTYDASEFLALATADGRLATRALCLLRDPYLFDTPPEKAEGRFLAVLQRT